MFEQIIGYDTVKNELLRFYDVIMNSQYYSNLGIHLPKGILLYGPPGVGKTLFATEFASATNRKNYILKGGTLSSSDIESIFNEAIQNSPSMILIDDMDKFGNSPYSSEFSMLQKCMDEITANDIFVIATANDMQYMGTSLIRSGRFDRIINVEMPSYNESKEIIKYYLSFKPVGEDIDYNLLAKLLEKKSCSTLEAVVNMAGLYAGYEKCNKIHMNHFKEAIMHVLYDRPISSYEPPREEKLINAYHEAGHAVVAEILNPGSSLLINIRQSDDQDGAFTDVYYQYKTLNDCLNNIKINLAGSAAVHFKFGNIDVGNITDMNRSMDLLEKLIEVHGYAGFNYLIPPMLRSTDSPSFGYPQLVGQYIENLYQETMSILQSNWSYVENIVNELLKKDYITVDELQLLKPIQN